MRYECVPKSQVRDSVLLRICEHRAQTIRCPSCKPKINIVSANYGRLIGGHICGGPVRTVRTTNCGAAGSLDKVKRSCRGKRSCRLTASNGIYGDPCVGTYKYLEVRVTQFIFKLSFFSSVPRYRVQQDLNYCIFFPSSWKLLTF